MYKSMYTNSRPYTWNKEKKVDLVCSKMLRVLEKDLENNFMPVLSCLVKNSESKNETALLRIQSMRGNRIMMYNFLP